VLAVNAAVAERAKALAGSVPVVAVDVLVGSTEDARTVAALTEASSRLVVDGYPFAPDFAEQAGIDPEHTLRIDDHGRAPAHPAAVVLDQNLGSSPMPYHDRPRGSTLLLGSRYALLRADDGDGHPERGNRPRHLLVALGGDPTPELIDLVGRTLPRVTEDLGLAADVIGGGDLGSLAAPGVTVHGFVADPGRLFASADLALAAAGTTTWDLCRRGIPSVVVAAVENQEPIVRAVIAAGAARGLRGDDAVGPLTELWADAELRGSVSRAGTALVDGRGADRVVAALRSRDVDLRPATAADARLLWHWANDDAVRAAAFDPTPIAWADHEVWLADHLADAGSAIYLAGPDGQAAWGQIRFDRHAEGTGVIDVSVAADHRGSGRAAPLIRAGVRRAFADNPALLRVRAHVRPSNHRSGAAFSIAGLAAMGERDGVSTFEGGRNDDW